MTRNGLFFFLNQVAVYFEEVTFELRPVVKIWGRAF